MPNAKHHPSVSVNSEEITNVALCGLTASTFFAFTREYREDMISLSDICHALSHALNDSESTKEHDRNEINQRINGEKSHLDQRI